MDVFEFAMNMEKDGENYYRELAGSANHKGMVNILNMLAEDEVKHYNILEEMKAGATELGTRRAGDSEVLKTAKNIFQQMKEEGGSFDFNISEIELYKKAQELEKGSEDFYVEKAGETASDVEKQILLKIADEEKRHYFLLENLIQFLSKPNNWLENAEFFHLDEY
jgi:rubrerythrin